MHKFQAYFEVDCFSTSYSSGRYFAHYQATKVFIKILQLQIMQPTTVTDLQGNRENYRLEKFNRKHCVLFYMGYAIRE